MTQPTDDLDAVRQISQILEPFKGDDRERIIRWVREKLGMVAEREHAPPATTPPPPVPSETGQATPKDIRAFINEKVPKNDQNLAAVIAYFYHFLASEDERKDHIVAADITEACRKADWERPGAPAQSLINAYHSGLFDRAEKGSYRLNAVGENLVAMVLPEGEQTSKRAAKRVRKKKKAKRKGVGSRARKKGVTKTKKKASKRSKKKTREIKGR